MTATTTRRAARIVLFVGLIALQLAMVVRAYWAPHSEFGYQMFPESSRWQADIVRVTVDGDVVPITESWFGYEWNDLMPGRGLTSPWRQKHADAGVDNQLEFLREALAWVAANTPDDPVTVRLEARVTVWPNLRDPEYHYLRSPATQADTGRSLAGDSLARTRTRTSNHQPQRSPATQADTGRSLAGDSLARTRTRTESPKDAP